jgi:hypothetical protein
LKSFLSCKIEKSIYQLSSPLTLDKKEEIMELKIFNEKILSSFTENEIHLGS